MPTVRMDAAGTEGKGKDMRAIEGQHSDRVAIKRTPQEKRVILTRLKEELAAMKPWYAPAIRESMVKRIADLEADLKDYDETMARRAARRS